MQARQDSMQKEQYLLNARRTALGSWMDDPTIPRSVLSRLQQARRRPATTSLFPLQSRLCEPCAGATALATPEPLTFTNEAEQPSSRAAEHRAEPKAESFSLLVEAPLSAGRGPARSAVPHSFGPRIHRGRFSYVYFLRLTCGLRRPAYCWQVENGHMGESEGGHGSGKTYGPSLSQWIASPRSSGSTGPSRPQRT